MRIRRAVAAAASAVALLGAAVIAPSMATAAVSHPAGTAYPQDWCSFPKAPPCVVSLSQDGTAILSSSTTWVASISNDANIDGDTEVQWSVNNENDGVKDGGSEYASMGPDQTSHLWSMTVTVDSNPRALSGYMDQMQTSVTDNGDGTWDVTITGYPVTTGVNAECQPVTPESCPYQAGADVTLFQAQSDDFQYSLVPSNEWNDYNGLREWTNVEESDLPPQVSGSPLQITEQLTNSHLLSTGAVFSGFFHAVLPNAFLVDMGIDDPSTIDPGSVSTSIGSGTVAVVPGADSTEIDITGITFTHRVLKIKRGTITPTRPTITKGKRSAHRVLLHFSRAHPRGSHIVRYQAICRAPHQRSRTSTAKGSPIVVKGLASGVRYACQVRAKSKAGYGRWSKKHTVRK
jgi:fibronectin type III domain protein